MDRVVFYARVSTEEEKQINALGKQVEELTNFINNQKDWIVVPNVIPAIVSEEIWKKANELLSDKVIKYHKLSSSKEDDIRLHGYFKGSFSLSKKIICGKCGKTYWHDNRSKTQNPVWECQSYKMYGCNSDKGCDNPIIREDDIINVCKNVLFNFFTNNCNTIQNIQNIISILNSTIEDSDVNIKVKTLNNKKFKLEEKQSKLLDSYLEKIINKNLYLQKTEEITKQINDFNKQLQQLNNAKEDEFIKEKRIAKIVDFLHLKINSPKEITDEIINNMIEKIVIYDDYWDMFFGLGENVENNTKLNNNSSYVYKTTIKDSEQQINVIPIKSKNSTNHIQINLKIRVFH